MVSHWVYTRFGIGISDEQWWNFRTRLFQAVTAPSMMRHVRSGVQWVIFVDADLPACTRKVLDSIAGIQGKGRVLVRPLRFACELPEALASEIGIDKIVGLSRLDDDDAISADFFEALQNEQMPCVVSQSWGYEADLATRVMRKIHSPLLSLNTTYIGPANLVAEYARIGHHRVGVWAAKQRLPIKEIRSATGYSFIYSRHKQSDTSFGARRKAILEDPNSTPLTQATRMRFGFDETAFQAWRGFAQTAPSTPASKTWEKTSELNAEAHRLFTELAKIRIQLKRATADVFSLHNDDSPT